VEGHIFQPIYTIGDLKLWRMYAEIDFDTESNMELPNNRRVITQKTKDSIIKYEVNSQGIPDGIFQEWYKNGTYELSSYINGHIYSFYQQWNKGEDVCGLHKEWHDNGFAKSLYNTVNGTIDGLYQEWDDKGEVVKSVMYKGQRTVSRSSS
jgi:antitoxin component YwqK of YwqJK toxin-antitoxin module